ncbi:DNA pilot protein [Peromfec virus RodF8_61]|uniref:DNA pilot protein n=1 Tax=Peromfec virus RodF8_61 TaxID=2929387 RepID=A0A976N1J4_9VIRU|nr:DNA pilot protein [Peromfec virus RodF8_61]
MSILSVLGSLGGSLWASSQNKSSAQDSIAFQKETLQNRNQWTVEDLKKAGLNPILAAGTTQSTAHGAQATAENPATGAVQSAVATKQLRLAERQQQNADMLAKSQADLNSAQAARATAEAQDYASKSDAGFYISQTDQMGASAEQARENVKYMGAQQQEIREKINESQARQRQIAEQTRRVNHEIQKIRDEQNELRSRLQLNLSHASESTTRSSLNRANEAVAQKVAQLHELEKSLTQEKIQTQKFITFDKAADVDLKSLQIPGAKNEAAWQGSPVGRFIERHTPRVLPVHRKK